ncbi:MAG TPA: YceI family protein [Gemmatimonadaceae bacterium]|nr:YceI family protein [Gemmatimonadaceae bacterium]
MTSPTTTKTTAQSAGTSTWKLDPAHSSIEFAVRHLMIATVRGRFGGIDGTLTLDERDPRASRVEATIQTASIDTRTEQRDQHLRSADFFDVERFPTISFRSRRIDGDVNGSFRVTGDLTIRDVMREVVLDATNNGRAKDPWGNEHLAIEARGKVDRREFGLTWNQALEAGGVLVGDEIKLNLEVQFLKNES